MNNQQMTRAISLMDSNTDEHEDLSNDPEKLLQHLGDRIEDMSRLLKDDEEFCNRDIDASMQYVQTIEKKFQEKIEKLKAKLEQIRQDNQTTSERNTKQFQDQTEEINELFTTGKHREAWKKFQDYEKSFAQRPTVIQYIPKLHMKERDIEQYFSSDYKPTKSSPIQPPVVIPPSIVVVDDKQDSTDDIPITNKERLRTGKVIESARIGKDDEEVQEEKTEQNVDNSQFGIRSEQQQATSTATITNSPSTTVPLRPIVRFSTRLGPTSNNNNLLFSGRNISSVQNPHVNPVQTRSTPTLPNSIPTISQRQRTTLSLTPVSHYQHERNTSLLMICNSQYIVLFKSQLNRLDRWHLGAIERGSHIEHSLDWHDGLIISMGYIGNNEMYMFTEREIFIYSISQRRKLISRILPRGNDDEIESSHFANEYQRGIGTVFNNYLYHIYLNRKSRWALSKNVLRNVVHINDYDLTQIFPDVLRFIHFCVNEKTMNFLVQMQDLSYAVVFCSTNDCLINNSMLGITLMNAKQPLTISSVYIPSIKSEVFFINDPSSDILHLITMEKYLQSCPILAYAICYVTDKEELMIVNDKSICSIKFNELNLHFSSNF